MRDCCRLKTSPVFLHVLPGDNLPLLHEYSVLPRTARIKTMRFGHGKANNRRDIQTCWERSPYCCIYMYWPHGGTIDQTFHISTSICHRANVNLTVYTFMGSINALVWFFVGVFKCRSFRHSIVNKKK